ncbi:MAG: acetolactate synthase, small subunit [Chloroflexota bacterium]|nr:acetolactate synthase, small subunit [Chloroflexota bacterium]
MSADPESNGTGPGPTPTEAAQPAPAHVAPPPRSLPGGGETRRHVLVAIVMNRPGVLNRVSSLMRARNFNIDSLRATDSNRDEVLRLVELSRGRVVDLADGSIIVEVTGTESEIDTFVSLVRTYGIKELVRTGAVVMARGSGSIEEAIKR